MTQGNKNEIYLLSNYITKNHNFHNAITTFPRTGLVRDFFGEFGGEAFAASGYSIYLNTNWNIFFATNCSKS
jgi:hypothetical protein